MTINAISFLIDRQAASLRAPMLSGFAVEALLLCTRAVVPISDLMRLGRSWAALHTGRLAWHRRKGRMLHEGRWNDRKLMALSGEEHGG